ncbi:MAG: hypothetical protein ACRBK7_14330, partial [Acidimicrobiales bacterium]
RMALIGLLGFASFIAVLGWRHGPLASIYLLAAIALPIIVGLLAPTMSARHQWTWAVLTGALGLGLMGLSAGWVFSVLRVANARYFSGIGAMLAFAAGFILFVSARGILGFFGRLKVYSEIANGAQSTISVEKNSPEIAGLEPAEALAGH